MLKRFLKILGVILLIGIVSVFVRGYKYQVSKSAIKDEINIDSTQTPPKKVDENESNMNEEPQTSKEEVKDSNTNQKEETSIAEPNATSKSNLTPKPSATPNNNSASNNKQSTTTTTTNNNTNIEVKPWEKLGISEYDYYNKPAWSWQTVDFILNGSGESACISREDCRKKCQEYGDKYLVDHSGSYNCDTVNSYSGDYLGEDFTFIEL